jgi:hypothetical protein
LKKALSLIFLTVSAYGFFLTSCKNETVEPANDDQYRYFPLTTGFWTEYAVDSIVHLDIDDQNYVDTAIDTFHFNIREVIDTPFTDAVNETAYVIKRYTRNSDTLPWDFQNIFTAKLNTVSAQRVEDNIRFLRLQFPITSASMWNGNAYNYYPAEDYTYEDLYEQRTLNGLQFPSTVTVIQNDFVSLINEVMKEEIYAKDVGLIYKQLDSITFGNTSGGSIFIRNGLEYKRTITGYNH